MPFVNNSGRSFNCGFCRTLVYECMPKRRAKTSEETISEEKGKKKAKKVEYNTRECFQNLFVGPQFVIGPNYFEKKVLNPLAYLNLIVK